VASTPNSLIFQDNIVRAGPSRSRRAPGRRRFHCAQQLPRGRV